MARTLRKMHLSAWYLATDASVNSVKWWKKLNSKLYFKLSTQNLKNMFFLDPESKYEKNFHFKPCVYLAYFMSYGHLKIVKCIAMY